MRYEKKDVNLPPMKLKKLYFILLAALSAFFLEACCSDEDSPRLPGSPGTKMERTLIIYMAAENSLSSYLSEQYYSMPTDSSEIASGMASIPENTRVVLFIDDNKSSRLCVGTKKEPLQTMKVYDQNLCSTDGATMTAVLQDIVSTYPAYSYGLVLCSHGTGWLFDDIAPQNQAPRRHSFGVDNGNHSTSNPNYGRRMSIPTLASVLGQLPHMDFVMFDACFMQCIEVAYELRHVTDYIIASPAEIPAYGAPYKELLPIMCSVPTNVQDIVKGYTAYYQTGEGAYSFGGVELSVIRTDRLESLAQNTGPFLKYLLNGRKEISTDGVQRFYEDLNSDYVTCFFDLKNLFYKHLPSSSYQYWVNFFDEAVPVQSLTPQWFSEYESDPWYSSGGSFMEITDMEHTGGVSVYVPRSQHLYYGWLNDYHLLQWYQDTGMSSTSW